MHRSKLNRLKTFRSPHPTLIFSCESALYHVRAILQGDVCKKTESGNCQRSRLFFGILSLEKAFEFEPGSWSEIIITDLLKAKMAAH